MSFSHILGLATYAVYLQLEFKHFFPLPVGRSGWSKVIGYDLDYTLVHYRVKDRRSEQPFVGCRVGSVLDTWVMMEYKGVDAQWYTCVYGIPNPYIYI